MIVAQDSDDDFEMIDKGFDEVYPVDIPGDTLLSANFIADDTY